MEIHWLFQPYPCPIRPQRWSVDIERIWTSKKSNKHYSSTIEVRNSLSPWTHSWSSFVSSNPRENLASNDCNGNQLDVWSIMVSINVYIAIDSQTTCGNCPIEKSVQSGTKLSGSTIYCLHSFTDERKRNEEFLGNWPNICDDFCWYWIASETIKSNNRTRIHVDYRCESNKIFLLMFFISFIETYRSFNGTTNRREKKFGARSIWWCNDEYRSRISGKSRFDLHDLLDNERESLLFSHSFGYLLGSITSIATLFFWLLR